MTILNRLRLGAVAVIGAGALALAGCSAGLGGSSSGSGGLADGKAIKIGFVTPRTGSLAPFGATDTYVIDLMTTYFKSHPIKLADGTSHPVRIIVKDTGSDSNAAAQDAKDLILNDGVNLILAASTPDNANPVSDQCEANHVVCITSVSPWESWAGRDGGDPTKASFKYTYHFFWGLEDAEKVYNVIWKATAPAGAGVGLLLGNDPDGNAWRNATTGLPPFIAKQGHKPDDVGPFNDGTTDFSAQIAQFKAHDDKILVGNAVPPDFIAFWQQAVQQGYHPTTVTFAKSILFPSVVDSLGTTANNLSTEVWWAPTYPYKSSLTGKTAQQFADDYTKSTGQQWSQPLGFDEALFEVAAAALEKSSSLSADDLATTLSKLHIDSIAGPIDWRNGPIPNVAKTPLTGGQWRLQPDGSYQLVIVANPGETQIPLGGSPEPIDWN